MKKVILAFCVLVVLVSCASVDKHNLQVTKSHPVEDLHEDVDKAYTQLKRHHPRLYQFVSKETLDFKFDSLKRAIKVPMDSRAFYKQLAAVTKYVGQGHMSVSPPSVELNKAKRQQIRKTRFDINYIDTEYLDDKLIIADAVGQDTVLINAEILKIENESSQDLIETYKRLIASDGYNTTF
ncbi:MAG: peptidase S41, partial [Psychroserpens sp.]